MQRADPIVDYAERARDGGWSLRSALVRYAQPEPARAGALLELVRRTDAALKPHARLLQQTPDLDETARAMHRGGEGRPDGRDLDSDERALVDLLVVALDLDEIGDLLAAWAMDIEQPRPDDAVDGLARAVFARLAELGVARETRPPRRA